MRPPRSRRAGGRQALLVPVPAFLFPRHHPLPPSLGRTGPRNAESLFGCRRSRRLASAAAMRIMATCPDPIDTAQAKGCCISNSGSFWRSPAAPFSPDYGAGSRACSTRADRHSGDGESKIVVFRDPERSVPMAREHRKHAKPPFAGRQNGMSIGPGRRTAFARERAVSPGAPIWACARAVERPHGADAPRFVAERIGALAIAGDRAGAAMGKGGRRASRSPPWRQVCADPERLTLRFAERTATCARFGAEEVSVWWGLCYSRSASPPCRRPGLEVEARETHDGSPRT